jgi:hypothetical protein
MKYKCYTPKPFRNFYNEAPFSPRAYQQQCRTYNLTGIKFRKLYYYRPVLISALEDLEMIFRAIQLR